MLRRRSWNCWPTVRPRGGGGEEPAAPARPPPTTVPPPAKNSLSPPGGPPRVGGRGKTSPEWDPGGLREKKHPPNWGGGKHRSRRDGPHHDRVTAQHEVRFHARRAAHGLRDEEILDRVGTRGVAREYNAPRIGDRVNRGVLPHREIDRLTATERAGRERRQDHHVAATGRREQERRQTHPRENSPQHVLPPSLRPLVRAPLETRAGPPPHVPQSSRQSGPPARPPIRGKPGGRSGRVRAPSRLETLGPSSRSALGRPSPAGAGPPSASRRGDSRLGARRGGGSRATAPPTLAGAARRRRWRGGGAARGGRPPPCRAPGGAREGGPPPHLGRW